MREMSDAWMTEGPTRRVCPLSRLRGRVGGGGRGGAAIAGVVRRA